MVWSLWSRRAPLNAVQRLVVGLAIFILPGIGSVAWWWWIKRYYPRRHAEDPTWDPAKKVSTRQIMGRPRPNRGPYSNPRD